MRLRSSTEAEIGVSLTFLLFLMVTREMLGTGFMPSFCMALRLFFSDLLCLLREEVPSSVQDIHNLSH